MMLIDLQLFIAPYIALLVALIENRGKHFADYILLALTSVGIAGSVDSYLPEHNMFIALLVGIMSGILTDDLFTKVKEEFPSLLDEIVKGFSTWVKENIKKFLKKGKK